MIKFIKIKDPNNEFDITDVEIRLTEGCVTLDEVVEAFNDFLGACGYGHKVEVEQVVEESE